MKTNRHQLRAGRCTSVASIWRYTYVKQDQFGQFLYTWNKLKDVRCFIDEMKGNEYFVGDIVEDKESFYLEFRFTDINTHDQIRFTDRWGRNLTLALVAVYDDDTKKRFIRAMGYELSPNEIALNPNTFSGLHNSHTKPTTGTTTGGTGTVVVKPPVHTNHDLPHVVSSDVVLTNHNQIDIIFDKPIWGEGDIKDTIKVHIGSKLIAPTLIGIDKGNDHRLIMTIPDTIKAGDVVTWSYIDSIVDKYIYALRADKTKAHFENQTFGVKNAIVAGVHTLDMMSSVFNGGSIDLEFNHNISGVLDINNVELIINGKVSKITGVSIIGKGLYFHASIDLYKGDVIHVETKGETGIVQKDNHAIKWTPVALFTVTNNSTAIKPVPITPDLVYANGTALTASTFDMIFDDDILSVDLSKILIKAKGTWGGVPLDEEKPPTKYVILNNKITFTTPVKDIGNNMETGYFEGTNTGYVHITDPNAIISTKHKGLVVGTHYDIKN